MKKILCIVLALVLVFAMFAGCNNNTQPSPTPAATPDATPEPTPDDAGEPEEPEEPTDEGYDFSDAKNVNLTYAIYLSDVDATTLDTARYFDMLKEYTEGTVDYTMYAGQTLCAGDEELDAVRSGVADVAFFPVAYGSGQLPISYMLEYPGVAYNSDEAASYTIREWFDTVNPAELSDFKILYAIGQGNGCFMTTFEVNSFADFAGKQIRCGAALSPVMEAYGINPTVMIFSEVYEALRTGVVQGFYGMLHAGNSAKLYEVTSCVTLDPYYIGGYIMIMNKGVWDSLTADQQAAIEEATDVAFADFLAPGRAADGLAAIDVFEENGLKIVNLSDEDIAKMGELNAPIQEEYANSVDGGAEALAIYKELAEKYNALY